MKRLFVFGCSFSSYLWPSWADLLSKNFNYYENWALAGTGNKAIFLRLTEFLSKNELTKNDTVIIQWTSHLRNDFYTQEWYTERKPLAWKTYGSIFSYLNQDIYDKKWIKTFFYEPAYLYETLNYIHAAQRMLEGTSSKYIMTSMNDFKKLKFDAAEGVANVKIDTGEFQSYVNSTLNKDIWVESIQDFCSKESDYWNFLIDIKRLKFEKDPHPNTRAYTRWLEQCLLPKLNLDNYKTPSNILDTIDQLYLDSNKNKDTFSNMLIDKGIFKQHVYRGF